MWPLVGIFLVWMDAAGREGSLCFVIFPLTVWRCTSGRSGEGRREDSAVGVVFSGYVGGVFV